MKLAILKQRRTLKPTGMQRFFQNGGLVWNQLIPAASHSAQTSGSNFGFSLHMQSISVMQALPVGSGSGIQMNSVFSQIRFRQYHSNENAGGAGGLGPQSVQSVPYGQEKGSWQ